MNSKRIGIFKQSGFLYNGCHRTMFLASQVIKHTGIHCVSVLHCINFCGDNLGAKSLQRAIFRYYGGTLDVSMDTIHGSRWYVRPLSLFHLKCQFAYCKVTLLKLCTSFDCPIFEIHYFFQNVMTCLPRSRVEEYWRFGDSYCR